MVQESINDEIKWLESQLEAKKKELSSSGAETQEKEIIREAIRKAGAVAPPLPAPAISDDDAQKKAHELQEKEHIEIVEELVTLAVSKGLISALKVANSLRNPHILDELHDTLADKYYEKLLEARKLKQ